jgi:hypothetical protein
MGALAPEACSLMKDVMSGSAVKAGSDTNGA